MGGFLICKVIKSTLHITESKLKPRFLVQCQVGAQFLTGKKKKKVYSMNIFPIQQLININNSQSLSRAKKIYIYIQVAVKMLGVSQMLH